MTLKFVGKKLGMTRLFNEKGNHVVCTVVSAEPNVVTQVKSKEQDGYAAVQLAGVPLSSSRAKNVTKPLRGHFAKAGVAPHAVLVESRLSDGAEFQAGQEIAVDLFKEGDYIDVQGVSKGKGYQGVIKRHNFAGGPASHGSGFHRHGGSTGMRTSPGRCLPGQKKAGRMGAEVVTVQNLRVVKVDVERKVLIVEGAIPGARGGVVYMSPACKKTSKQ